jgi:nicotinamide-nucleotide amidase
MKRAVQALANLLKEKELTIAFAESITCGLLAHQLGTIQGTAEILMGSIVCYNENMKTGLLKISRQLIDRHTAESQKVTDALAVRLSKMIEADIHAAITGLAAPGGSESSTKPVGTVFYSFIYKGKLYRMKSKFNGSPLEVKKKACEKFFRFISKTVTKGS